MEAVAEPQTLREAIIYFADYENCRKAVEAIRFPDVPYSEDQAFGRALLEAGWRKVYHPGAAVLHAHDYGPIEFMRRYFDEYRGLRETIGHVEGFGVRSSAKIVRGAVVRRRRPRASRRDAADRRDRRGAGAR